MSINITNKPESTSSINVNGGNVKLNIKNEGSAKSHLAINGGSGEINVSHEEGTVDIFNGLILSILGAFLITFIPYKIYRYVLKRKKEKFIILENEKSRMLPFTKKRDEILLLLNNYSSENFKSKVLGTLESLRKDFELEPLLVENKMDKIKEKLMFEKKDDEQYTETLRYIDLVRGTK